MPRGYRPEEAVRIKICPLCNAITAITANCPVCGGKLTDGGALENYFGPYSPYMDVMSLQHGEPDRHCVHLLSCPECGHDERVAWALVEV